MRIVTRNPNKKMPLSRRGFMARSACSAMGLSGIVNTLANLKLMEGALANNITTIDDYKCGIVLFHFGATDANNMLMPAASHPSRGAYDGNRGVLALPLSTPGNTDDPHLITAANLASEGTAPAGAEFFALHPRLPDMKSLFDAGDLAFASNVGTLVVPTKASTYNSVPLPPQLFSHSDQQNQWQSSVSDIPFQSGWQGRIADLLNVENVSGQISMSVSLSGINDIQVGLTQAAPQYSVTNNGAITLNGYGTLYANALASSNVDTSYLNNGNARRLKAYQDIMKYTHDHLFEEGYNTVVRRARENEGFTGSALAEAELWLHPTAVHHANQGGAPWPNIEATFLIQSGIDPAQDTAEANILNQLPSLSRQLLQIAKLITGRRCLGNKRQLFFCSYGGHDTHQDQGGFGSGVYVPGDLDANMTMLNDALKAFSDCMHDLETREAGFPGPPSDAFNYEDFLLASHSDFNRTFTPNGSIAGPSGSDHAYATNCYMMGGDVKGGNVYGYYPDLLPTGNWGTPGSSRGRWIPTSSVEQFAAPMAKWLGLTDDQLEVVFPNLERFADPFTTAYNRGSGLDDYDAMLGAANMNYINGIGLP